MSRGTSTKKGSSISVDGVVGDGLALGEIPVVDDAVSQDNLLATMTNSSSSPSYTPTSCGKSNLGLMGLGDKASLLALADNILTLLPADVLA
jgi:hypothetical protein